MRKISEGRTAEVFAQDQGKILKLYRDGFPKEAVRYEYEVNRIVTFLGIPAPRVYDLIDMDQKNGIVFEWIEGSTLLRRGIQYPTELNRLAKEFADLHLRIHKSELNVERIEGSSVLGQKTVLTQNIQNASELPDKVKKEILDELRSLPDGNGLCHGDLQLRSRRNGKRS